MAPVNDLALWLPLLAIRLNNVSAQSACLTVEQCQRRYDELNLGGDFYHGNSYPEKGCFRKNHNVYFGTEGTDEEKSTAELRGVLERVWCDEEPTPAPANPSDDLVQNLLGTESPSRHPTPEPTFRPTGSPTLSPSESPTGVPSSAPSMPPSGAPSIAPTVMPSSSPSVTMSAVALSPFTLSLETATEEVDATELEYLVSSHLKKEMEASFLEAEVGRAEVDVVPAPNRRLQEESESASNSTISQEHDFDVNGTAYFADHFVPSPEELDDVALGSFEGDGLDDFVHSLQNAEDPGLQTAASASATDPNALLQSSYLKTSDENLWGGFNLYYLAIVFGVGLALLGMFVAKNRQVRKIRRQREMGTADAVDEESAAVVPKFIQVENEESLNSEAVSDDVRPWYRAIRQAMTDRTDSTPVTSNTGNTGKKARSDMSTLSGTLPDLSEAPSNDNTQLRDLGSLISVGSQSTHQASNSLAVTNPNGTTKASDNRSVAQSEKTDLTGELSTFAGLQSVSEVSAKTRVDESFGWGEIVREGFNLCIAEANDTGTVGARMETRLMGSFWGQKPDDLTSEYYSQSQYTSQQTRASYYTEETSSTRTSKVDNTQ